MELLNLITPRLDVATLQGVSLISVFNELSKTRVGFEISDVKVDFSCEEGASLQMVSLTANGQVYSDEATLGQYRQWAEYLWGVISPHVTDVVAAQAQQVSPPTPAIPVVPVAAQPVSPVSAIPVNSYEPQPSFNSHMYTQANVLQTQVATEEALANAHKEGYKAARKKNIKELKKLKKKHQMTMFFTIFGLLLIFSLYMIFHEVINEFLPF